MTGPFVTNILAGGGNFRHMLEYIGNAAKVWTEDMRKHAFDLNPDTISALDAKVQDSIGRIDVGMLEKKRDEVLLDLIELKSKKFSTS